jgi:hypothetical protein
VSVGSCLIHVVLEPTLTQLDLSSNDDNDGKGASDSGVAVHGDDASNQQ